MAMQDTTNPQHRFRLATSVAGAVVAEVKAAILVGLLPCVCFNGDR